MKTFVKVLALSLVAVMMCAVLVSCGGPNKDPKKAAEALEEAGYEVALIENEKGDIKATISASKIDGEKKDAITITYFADKDAANEAWDEAQESLDEVKALLAVSLGCEEGDIVAKKSGTIVYIGTKDAVKAAK